MKAWKQLSTEVKFKNPWWEYRQDSVELPDGSKGEYHYVHTSPCVSVIPVTADGKIVVIRQLRYLFGKPGLELVCGGSDDGDVDPEASARRECMEECGYDPGSLEQVGNFATGNSLTNQRCLVYIATNLAKTEVRPEETEQIAVELMAPSDIDAAIASGEMWDGVSIAAWTLARNKLS